MESNWDIVIVFHRRFSKKPMELHLTISSIQGLHHGISEHTLLKETCPLIRVQNVFIISHNKSSHIIIKGSLSFIYLHTRKTTIHIMINLVHSTYGSFITSTASAQVMHSWYKCTFYYFINYRMGYFIISSRYFRSGWW